MSLDANKKMLGKNTKQICETQEKNYR